MYLNFKPCWSPLIYFDAFSVPNTTGFSLTKIHGGWDHLVVSRHDNYKRFPKDD